MFSKTILAIATAALSADALQIYTNATSQQELAGIRRKQQLSIAAKTGAYALAAGATGMLAWGTGLAAVGSEQSDSGESMAKMGFPDNYCVALTTDCNGNSGNSDFFGIVMFDRNKCLMKPICFVNPKSFTAGRTGVLQILTKTIFNASSADYRGVCRDFKPNSPEPQDNSAIIAFCNSHWNR